MSEQDLRGFSERRDKKLVELSDGVIMLKPFSIADAEEHLKGDDKEQAKWLSGGKSTIDGVKEWIVRNQEFWQKDGPIFNFSIRTVDGELVGMVEANTDSKSVEGVKDGDANVSYGLYPRARGKGYMRRAMGLLEDFLRERGINGAVIRVAPENSSSLKVPIGCGFTETGRVVTDKGETFVIFEKDLQKVLAEK